MPTLLDLLLVAFFAGVAPVIDYAFYWPAFRQRAAADPAGARRRLWISSIVQPWLVVAIIAALWTVNGRSWAHFGFSVPHGWRLWASIAVLLLAAAYYIAGAIAITRSADTRANVRQQVETIATLMPHTRGEMHLWTGVSLTAGFCEEFLYRGYLIWVFTPWLGWWGAAALGLLIFAGWHAYQGWNGVLRTGITGAIFTLVVAVFDSLWPAIALHALVDGANGMMAWLALRGPSTENRELRIVN